MPLKNQLPPQWHTLSLGAVFLFCFVLSEKLLVVSEIEQIVYDTAVPSFASQHHSDVIQVPH